MLVIVIRQVLGIVAMLVRFPGVAGVGVIVRAVGDMAVRVTVLVLVIVAVRMRMGVTVAQLAVPVIVRVHMAVLVRMGVAVFVAMIQTVMTAVHGEPAFP